MTDIDMNPAVEVVDILETHSAVKPVESKDEPILIPNIMTCLRKPNESSFSRRNMMTRSLYRMFKLVEQLHDRQHKINVILSIFELLVEYLDVLNSNTYESNNFVIEIKKKFDEFIIKENITELIPLYNQIFNDKLYDNIHCIGVEDITLPTDDDIKIIVNKYNNDVTARIKRQEQPQPQPPYEEGEIIGARDNKGKWWMARLLKVFTHIYHDIYYVEFLIRGHKYNDAIIDPYRLARYDPQNHPYERSANEDD
jgi:hypothetical protein